MTKDLKERSVTVHVALLAVLPATVFVTLSSVFKQKDIFFLEMIVLSFHSPYKLTAVLFLIQLYTMKKLE